MKIVIVEDEIRIREGMGKLLGKIFPELTLAGEAANGKEGLECILKCRPDIVITDIKMPVMDGLEMLREVQAQGLQPKVIVLTAYSEFSYAQQAVKLGVKDYLIKPVVVQEFTQTMKRVIHLCEQEQERTPEIMGSLENVVSGILHSALSMDEGVAGYLDKKYGIQKDTPFLELLAYLGDFYEEGKAQKMRELKGTFRQNPNVSYCMTEMEYDRTILVLIYSYASRQEVERWFQSLILCRSRDDKKQCSYGLTEVSGICRVREGYQELMQYMDWNIVLGEDVLISYPKILDAQTGVCIYPIELENQMKSAVCSQEPEKVQKILRKFRETFHDGKVYVPREIKESYVRFLWAFIGVAREVGCIDYQSLDQQQLLDYIMNAKTCQELDGACGMLMGKFREKSAGADRFSLHVRKAISLIQEFYGDGITLGEISEKLNLTQEYLGNQFHKETGENFSAYIRNYRMSKAKELLIGTQMKQYEIAEKVGYTDPKYFARVFRECVGMSPADYRKTNR